MYLAVTRFVGIFLAFLISVAHSARILLFTAFPNHRMLMMEVASLLNAHGHQSEFLSYQSDIEVLREQAFPVHLVNPDLNLTADVENAASLEQPYSAAEEHKRLRPTLRSMASMCSHLLDAKELQQRLLAQNYSVLFLDLYANDLCPILMARKLGIPVIGFWPWSLSLPSSYFMGVPSLPALVPTVFTGYLQGMSFTQRIGNLFAAYYEMKRWQDDFYTLTEAIIRQHSSKSMTAMDLYNDVSLLMTNENVLLEYARPSLPAIIPVGGFHCQLAQPISKDAEEFVKKFRGGIIFITLPKIFHDHADVAEVFSKISTHAVLWEEFPATKNGEGANILRVNISDRQDILGHQRMRLFVTPCDTSEVISSIFHGVPILCIPITSHQYTTALRVSERHLGLTINKFNLTKLSIQDSLQRLLNNKRYMAHARQASLLFRDQPEVPSDRLIYWIEFVIRNKGVPAFMSSPPSRHLSISQYYFVDLTVIATILAQLIFIIILSLAYLLYKIAWRPNSVQKGKME